MKQSQYDKAFETCKHLLLAGSPGSVIVAYCERETGIRPSDSLIYSWRQRAGVFTRKPYKAPKKPRRLSPEEAIERDQIQTFNRLVRFMRPIASAVA